MEAASASLGGWVCTSGPSASAGRGGAGKAALRGMRALQTRNRRCGQHASLPPAHGVLDLHPYQLRHTAASLAIASGADVKVVQQMLGHSSATRTLDTYATSSRTGSTRSGTPWAELARPHRPAGGPPFRCPVLTPVLPESISRRNAEEAPPSVSAGRGPFSDLYPRPDSNRRYRLERAAC
jgi:hypothetical protein